MALPLRERFPILFQAPGDTVHSAARFPGHRLKQQRSAGGGVAAATRLVCDPDLTRWSEPVACTQEERDVGVEGAEVNASDDEDDEEGDQDSAKAKKKSGGGSSAPWQRRRKGPIMRKAKERIWKLEDGESSRMYHGHPDGKPPTQLFMCRFDSAKKAYCLTPIEQSYRFTKQAATHISQEVVEEAIRTGGQQDYGDRRFNKMKTDLREKKLARLEGGQAAGAKSLTVGGRVIQLPAEESAKARGASSKKKSSLASARYALLSGGGGGARKGNKGVGSRVQESWSAVGGLVDSSGEDYDSDDAYNERDMFTRTHGADGADVGDGNRSDDDVSDEDSHMFFDRDNHEIDFSDSEHESGEETAFDKWKKAEYAKVAEAKREKEAAEAAAKEQAAQGDEDSVNMDELQRTAQYGNKTNKRSRSAMESTGSAGGGTAGDSVGAVADGAQAGGRKKRAREESSEPGSSLGGKPKKRKKKFKAELSRAGLRELMEKHDGRISSKDLIKAYKYKVKPGVPGFKENQAKFRQLISEILAKVDDGGGNIYYILKQK